VHPGEELSRKIKWNRASKVFTVSNSVCSLMRIRHHGFGTAVGRATRIMDTMSETNKRRNRISRASNGG